MLDRQHVADLFDRSVHNENTADDENAGGEVHRALDDAFPCKNKERLGQQVDQVDHYEQQCDAQRDGDDDTPEPDCPLLRDRRALRFDRDIEQTKPRTACRKISMMRLPRFSAVRSSVIRRSGGFD